MERLKELFTNPLAYMAGGVAASGLIGFLTADKLGWLVLAAGGLAGLLSRKVNPAAPTTAELRGLVDQAVAELKQ